MASEMLEKILEAENEAKLKLAASEKEASLIIEKANLEAKEIVKKAKLSAEQDGKVQLDKAVLNAAELSVSKIKEADKFCESLDGKIGVCMEECKKIIIDSIVG